jgi:hypothetical protein
MNKTLNMLLALFFALMISAIAMLGYIISILNYNPPIPVANKVEVSMAYPIVTHIERATTYQPTVAQCDSDPYTTADGSRINPNNMQKWVALSRDLIYCEERQKIFKDTTHWRGLYSFGDTIIVWSEKHPQINGEYAVHDCMHWDYKNSLDFLGVVKPKLGIGKDIKLTKKNNHHPLH